MKRVAPAPSDAALAAAEQTDTIRRRDRIAAIEEQQEDEKLALAGDPEAQERMSKRAAILASASVLGSTPIPPEEFRDAPYQPPEEKEDEKAGTTSDAGARTLPKRTRQSRPAETGTSRTRRRREVEAASPPPQQEEEPDEEAIAEQTRQVAWRLMETAYKKWKKTAQKDLRKANHDLALDLGGDAVLYLRNDIIRMADLHSTIEKLTASPKAGKDATADEENFDDEMEDFRRQLRGEK